MDSQKYQINMAPGVNEATVRIIELEEDNYVLPALEPISVELCGTINAVHEYLAK